VSLRWIARMNRELVRSMVKADAPIENRKR
jgi:hypothetical protein